MAALLALALLAACEIATRAFFVPSVVGAETWTKYYPAYDSGFAEDGVCHPIGAEEACLATPYMDTHAVSFPRAKPATEKRIFVVGTSPSRLYPRLLGKALHKKHPTWKVRVINLSLSGIGTERLRLLFSEVLDLGPDAIVLHPHGTSEFKDAREHQYQADLHRGLGGLLLRSQFVVVSKKWLLEALHLQGVVEPTRTDRREAMEAARDPDNSRRYLKTMERNIDAMLASARQRKVPVLLVGRTSLPGKDFYGRSLEKAVNASLQRSAHKHQTPYFDLTAAVRKLRRIKPAFRDGVHFTRLGNEHVANELEPAVSTLLR